MDVTLEQAKVFDAVARLGTLQKAAAELNRGHSSVVYALKCLEDQTGLRLFDREGYRNRITGEGEAALKHCRRLLEAHDEFATFCRQKQDGWEPSLKLIYDEVVDFGFVGHALFRLNRMKSPTTVKVLSAHLHDVEDRFAREDADIMVTILPLQRLRIPSRKLDPIRMHLVAHRDHPLAATGTGQLSTEDLQRHTFVTITTAPGLLGFGTEQMSFNSSILVNSFNGKKTAILSGLGFGWLPDYLIRPELRKGTLRTLRTEIESVHKLTPRLYHRPEERLGKAARELLKHLA